MLSEISQTEKDKYCMRSLICGMEKIKQTSECNRFAAKENKLVVTKQGEGRKEGQDQGRGLRGTNYYV